MKIVLSALARSGYSNMAASAISARGKPELSAPDAFACDGINAFSSLILYVTDHVRVRLSENREDNLPQSLRQWK